MSPAYPTPLLYLDRTAHLYNIGWKLSESGIICDYTIILATARKKVMQYDLRVATLLQIVCPTFPSSASSLCF